REFVSTWGLAAAGSALVAAPSIGSTLSTGAVPAAGDGPGSAGSNDDQPFRLGVCTYSLRDFQRNLPIKMINELDAPCVSVKEFHLPYTVTPNEAARAVGAFQKAGLKIVSGGAIPLESDDPALLRRYFEYARMCGMPMIVSAPTTREALPHVEKLAREF